jgi:hypothetical protein
MTTFYNFSSSAAFIAAGGVDAEGYTAKGVGYSIIGDTWSQPTDDTDLIYAGYLVNTTEPVSEWSGYLVTPVNPMRLFG